jgi:hypothetical protein
MSELLDNLKRLSNDTIQTLEFEKGKIQKDPVKIHDLALLAAGRQRAVAMEYYMKGERKDAGFYMMSQAALLADAGEFESAVDVYREAQDVLNPNIHSHTVLRLWREAEEQIKKLRESGKIKYGVEEARAENTMREMLIANPKWLFISSAVWKTMRRDGFLSITAPADIAKKLGDKTSEDDIELVIMMSGVSGGIKKAFVIHNEDGGVTRLPDAECIAVIKDYLKSEKHGGKDKKLPDGWESRHHPMWLDKKNAKFDFGWVVCSEHPDPVAETGPGR